MTTIQGDSVKRIEAFKNQKIETLAIHGGQKPDPITGAVMPPIYLTSTYAQKEPGIPVGEFTPVLSFAFGTCAGGDATGASIWIDGALIKNISGGTAGGWSTAGSLE
jgi:hypothetical protein